MSSEQEPTVFNKEKSHRVGNRGRSLGRRVLAAFLMLAVAGSPAIVGADTNESSPSNPDAAMSGLLTLGDYNTCYVLGTTNVKCWGYNKNGVVGDGTFTDATTAKDVTGLTGVASISSGQGACAVTTVGGLKCWGVSPVNGTATKSSAPADLPGLTSGVLSVSAGAGQACAVLSGGALKCWGRNMNGELGDGTTTESLTPVEVTGLTSGVASVSVGGGHVCALMKDGGVQCWGQGQLGQVGDNNSSPDDRLVPTQVTGLTSGVEAISAGGEFTCALLSIGAVKCWGRGDDGQVGNASNDIVNLAPVQVSGLTGGVVAIAAGERHACALLSTGAVKCWGANSEGELGDGTTTNSNVPVDVIGLGAKVKAVSAGTGSTCVMIAVDDLRCFGTNYYGELGNGTTDSSTAPVKVMGLPSVSTTTAPTTTVPRTTMTEAGSNDPAPTASDVDGPSTLPSTGSDGNLMLTLAMSALLVGAVIQLSRRGLRTHS